MALLCAFKLIYLIRYDFTLYTLHFTLYTLHFKKILLLIFRMPAKVAGFFIKVARVCAKVARVCAKVANVSTKVAQKSPTFLQKSLGVLLFIVGIRNIFLCKLFLQCCCSLLSINFGVFTCSHLYLFIISHTEIVLT